MTSHTTQLAVPLPFTPFNYLIVSTFLPKYSKQAADAGTHTTDHDPSKSHDHD